MFAYNFCYILLNYRSNCVLFISLMQSVNEAQFSNVPYLSLLFGTVPVFGNAIISLKTM